MRLIKTNRVTFHVLGLEQVKYTDIDDAAYLLSEIQMINETGYISEIKAVFVNANLYEVNQFESLINANKEFKLRFKNTFKKDKKKK
jgi:hypothetical protein